MLSLASCARNPGARTDGRIAAVEQGLLSEYGDPAWTRMELAERMDHYHVPGVSITVINNSQVAWARGYSLLEGGGAELVTPETLFQTASLAKSVVAVAAPQYVQRGALELDGDVN